MYCLHMSIRRRSGPSIVKVGGDAERNAFNALGVKFIVHNARCEFLFFFLVQLPC